MPPKHYYGWKENGKYYLSLQLRGNARNEYLTSTDALREASKRQLPIVWEDPKVID